MLSFNISHRVALWCFPGMDLSPTKEGGTWLGVSKSGKLGAITNYLEAKINALALGRGEGTRRRVQQNGLFLKGQHLTTVLTVFWGVSDPPIRVPGERLLDRQRPGQLLVPEEGCQRCAQVQRLQPAHCRVQVSGGWRDVVMFCWERVYFLHLNAHVSMPSVLESHSVLPFSVSRLIGLHRTCSGLITHYEWNILTL